MRTCVRKEAIYEGKIKVNDEIWQPPAINKYEIDYI